MAQLLPDGLQDPASLDVLPDDSTIRYGKTWEFHMGGACACLDGDSPHLVVTGNQVSVLDGIETLAQWVRFALATERNRWLIYSTDFGTEFFDIISNSVDPESTITEVEATIEEALSVDERISRVTDITTTYEEGSSALLVEVSLVSFAGETFEFAFDVGLDSEENL